VQNCEKFDIAGYSEGRFFGAELLEAEEHFRGCPSCAAALEKLVKVSRFLNSWEEKTEFSKDFDTLLLRKAADLTTRRRKTVRLFSYAWRTAACLALLLGSVSLYKNTVYDQSIFNLQEIYKSGPEKKTDIQDFKFYLTSGLVRELAGPQFNQKNILNYELLLSVPENTLAADQKRDLKELLAEKIRFKRSERNIVFLALDGTVKLLEEGLKIKLSFGSPSVQQAAGAEAFKKAALAYETGNYETALEGYRTVYTEAKDDTLVSSSLFRLGFINERLGRYGEAGNYYKLVQQKYPVKIQAVMATELLHFTAKKKYFAAEAEALISTGGEEKSFVFYKIAGIYLQIMDYKTAAHYYTRASEDAKEPLLQRSQFNAGWCYKNLGEERKAAGLFAVLSQDRNFGRLAAYELALSYLKTGETANVGGLVDFGKETTGESPEIYKTLIKKYFKAAGINGKGELWK